MLSALANDDNIKTYLTMYLDKGKVSSVRSFIPDKTWMYDSK